MSGLCLFNLTEHLSSQVFVASVHYVCKPQGSPSDHEKVNEGKRERGMTGAKFPVHELK